MIEILPNFPVGCLVVHFNGGVNNQGSQVLIDALELAEGLIARGKQVSLVVDLTGFKFYEDVKIVRMDFKVASRDFKQIHRTAIVGSQKWIEWFTGLFGPFTQTKEKHFPEGELEAAREWACG